MCGIIGIVGKKDVSGLAHEALSILEYRGYDSWGFAYLQDHLIQVKKETGFLPPLESIQLPPACCIMGHTRWATHGKVTAQNAHPIFSASRRIAVVHNGIVENASILKRKLEERGFLFSTQTDTEVIANLIDYHAQLQPSFLQALSVAFGEIEGDYAVVIQQEGSNDLYASRNHAPLLVGHSIGLSFVASDALAFLSHTNQVVYPLDREIIHLSAANISYYSPELVELSKTPQLLLAAVESMDRKNFAHFMLKEILDQPALAKRIAMESWEELEKTASEMKNADQVFLVGCGSSYHAALAARYLFAKRTSIPVSTIIGSEFGAFKRFLTPRTVVLAISQSGETADVLEAVRIAKLAGCRIISLVNRLESTLVRESDGVISLRAGVEVSVVSTKAYGAQLIILSALSWLLSPTPNEARLEVGQLESQLESLIPALIPRMQLLGEQLADSQHVFLMGRFEQYALALEGALKIKESTYIHAEGLSAGELKHGTIALMEPLVTVIALEGYDAADALPQIRSNVSEVKARGATVWGIGHHEPSDELYNQFIAVGDAKAVHPLHSIIALQLLSYYLAVKRGLNPDRPRNLAKSVTVK